MTTEKPVLTAKAITSVDHLVASSNQLNASLRIKFFITGVLFPTWCFLVIWATNAIPSFHEPWQSGHHSDYLTVLLSAPTVLYFIPLIAFSMTCLAIWCFCPKQFSTAPVLVGLYSGTLLALIFLALLFPLTFVIGEIAGIMTAMALAVAVYLIQRAIHRASRFRIVHLFILAFVVAALIPLIQYFELWRAIPRFLVMAELAILAGSPTLAFVTFLRASIFAGKLNKQNKSKSPVWIIVLTPISWLVAFLITWRYAIESMMLEYSNLPTSDPNCYVSAVAAKGHPRLVGTTSKRTTSKSTPFQGDGRGGNGSGQVNRQMKRLKFLEFALQAVAPKLHRSIRRFYNCSGPKAARLLSHSIWLADFAFLTLKPLEWLAIAVQILTKIPDRRINKIYSGKS